VSSNPRVPADFGLSAEIRRGVYDTIKAELLEKSARYNAPISAVVADAAAFEKFRSCAALYGAALGQAYLYLLHDIRSYGK